MARHIARGDTEETATERQVREAIQRHLGEDDVLISGLRLHDNTYGDVEIDLIVLMPNAGVGIVEVKGGTITYADGTWHQSGKDGTKEIDPAAQQPGNLARVGEFFAIARPDRGRRRASFRVMSSTP
jgi:hypothetical protein